MKKKYKTKFAIKVPLNIFETIIDTTKEAIVEKCGVLVGYRSNREYFVTHIIEDQMTTDKSPLGVTRTTKGVWNELNLIAKDHYLSDYIGEWHTHISGRPVPSCVDIHTMNTLLTSVYYSFLDKIILAIGTPEKGLAFWIFSLGNFRIKMGKLMYRVLE